MIETVGLTRKFRKFEAVSNLSLKVNAGEVFGFLGPNGAGKTTTIRILAGLLPPTAGSAMVGGYDVVKEPLAAKSITGFIPDTPFLFDRLTGSEFLRFTGRLYGMPPSLVAERGKEQLEFFDLTDWSDHLIRSYSHGMKKRLSMAAALLHNPEVLIVDEPMVGLDPLGVRKAKDLFRRLAGEGKTIFLTTHELATAEAVCDRMAILHRGSLSAMGSAGELAGQARAPGSPLEEIFLKLTLEGEGTGEMPDAHGP